MSHAILRKVVTTYVVLDFGVGPVVVGACLLGAVAFLLGWASTWALGIPPAIAVAAVGASWAGLGLGTRRAVQWILRRTRAWRSGAA